MGSLYKYTLQRRRRNVRVLENNIVGVTAGLHSEIPKRSSCSKSHDLQTAEVKLFLQSMVETVKGYREKRKPRLGPRES